MITVSALVSSSSGASATATATTDTSTTRGLITAFNPTSDNWNNPERNTIDGQQFFAENGNKAWSLTQLDSYTFRVEVRPGDLWGDDSTSRSEIQSKNTIPVGSEFSTEFYFTVEAGAVGSLSWRGVAQVHDGSPFVSLSILNDIINVLINQSGGGGSPTLEKTVPLQRGHRYNAKIQLRKSQGSDGYLKVFIDDVQIIEYAGALGSGTDGGSMKFGVYQGWGDQVTSPIAVVYDHIALNFAAPPPPPPLPPGLNNVGETNITTTNDSGNAGSICAQDAILTTAGQLKSLTFYVATAAGNLRLGLYGTNANNTNPGAKIWDGGPIALSGVGWKTINVTNGPMLQRGSYWLSFEPSSNAAAYRTGSGGRLRCGPATFGTMPATFPTPSYSDDNTHWSFYMTVNV